jgi:hypothetical protein
VFALPVIDVISIHQFPFSACDPAPYALVIVFSACERDPMALLQQPSACDAYPEDTVVKPSACDVTLLLLVS